MKCFIYVFVSLEKRRCADVSHVEGTRFSTADSSTTRTKGGFASLDVRERPRVRIPVEKRKGKNSWPVTRVFHAGCLACVNLCVNPSVYILIVFFLAYIFLLSFLSYARRVPISMLLQSDMTIKLLESLIRLNVDCEHKHCNYL